MTIPTQRKTEVKTEHVVDVKPEDDVVVSTSEVASQEVVTTTVIVTSPSTVTTTTTTLTPPAVKTESASPISTSKSYIFHFDKIKLQYFFFFFVLVPSYFTLISFVSVGEM